MYDSTCVQRFEFMEISNNLIRNRGNKFKLVQHHYQYDLRKVIGLIVMLNKFEFVTSSPNYPS